MSFYNPYMQLRYSGYSYGSPTDLLDDVDKVTDDLGRQIERDHACSE
jgi:hypothetical protein